MNDAKHLSSIRQSPVIMTKGNTRRKFDTIDDAFLVMGLRYGTQVGNGTD